ncbi:MAG: hypothetical protein HC831_05920 [Chloroflexia bacterium]|nr:hypothetical protein [Chloroflexia bacterium]
MKKQDIENILPLTPIQEGILFHAIQNPENDLYYEQYNCRLEGKLNVEEFKNAWQSVIDRHSVLRTQFLWENKDKPLQIVWKKAELNFHYHDFTHYSAEDQQIQMDSLVKQDERIGFDLKVRRF